MMRRFSAFSVLFVLLLPHLAGCAADNRITGDEYATLRRQVHDLDAPPIILDFLGPMTIEDLQGETLAMSFYRHGVKRVSFPLYNAHLKIAHTVIEELRSLGFRAHASPVIWQKWRNRLHERFARLSEKEIDWHINREELFLDEPKILLRPLRQKVDLLVERLTIRNAMKTVDPELFDDRPDSAAVRKLYYAGPPPALSLTLQVFDLDGRAVESTFDDFRKARFEGKFLLQDLKQDVLIGDPTVTGEEELDGSGVQSPEPGVLRLNQTQDVVDRAIRYAVRNFVKGVLPDLRRHLGADRKDHLSFFVRGRSVGPAR